MYYYCPKKPPFPLKILLRQNRGLTPADYGDPIWPLQQGSPQAEQLRADHYGKLRQVVDVALVADLQLEALKLNRCAVGSEIYAYRTKTNVEELVVVQIGLLNVIQTLAIFSL